MLRAARGHAALLRATRRMSSKVLAVTQESDFLDATAKPSLSVVYYTAAWCGPCQRIAPIYAKLADDNPAVAFLKVDVDEMADLAADSGISAMPTFHFMKSGKVIDQVCRARLVLSLHPFTAGRRARP